MFKILKYSFFDLVRSRWSYIYLLFYLILGFLLLFLSSDLSKAIITLMNIVLILTPLIATIFGIMYYYNSTEFTELLLAQPIKRSKIFIGQYLGIVSSLSMSLIIGLGIPFLIYGISYSSVILNFFLLLIIGFFFNVIFVSLSYNIGLLNENKIKGFGYAILMWLFFAVIYDGLFLITLIQFQKYPLDKLSLLVTILNPIDLGRILILLKLDISALMGYTGALFNKFFGNTLGTLICSFTLIIWTIFPIYSIIRVSKRKDF